MVNRQMECQRTATHVLHLHVHQIRVHIHTRHGPATQSSSGINSWHFLNNVCTLLNETLGKVECQLFYIFLQLHLNFNHIK